MKNIEEAKSSRRLDQINDIYKNTKEYYKSRKGFKHLRSCKKYNDEIEYRSFFKYCLICPELNKRDIEILYESILSMPPKASKAFESIWKIVNDYRKEAYKRGVELLVKTIFSNEEYKAKIERILWTNKEIKNEIKTLEDDKRILEDKIAILKEKLRNENRKYGMYTPIFREIDYKIEENKLNLSLLRKKDIIINVISKHLDDGDNDDLILAYDDCGNSLSKLYERFKSAYYTYVKRQP